MKLHQLKYMIEIVQTGSFNKAAQSLFVSQPSLSEAIKDLENEMGIEIFVRNNKGVILTQDGAEFLGYARQVIEQSELLEQRYLNKKPMRSSFSVSAQHYAFVVNAFVDLIREENAEEYEFALKETKTREIIEDVRNQRSEIGVLYKNEFNEKVIEKLLKENHLLFHPLFDADPHVFISVKNPLANRKSVSMNDLEDFPYFSFDQGEYNSFYFSEEILSTTVHKKAIRVSDRATLFNLLIGLDGFTISTGILSEDLNGTNIVSIPLEVEEKICLGWIANQHNQLSRLGKIYIKKLEKAIQLNQI